MDAVIDPILKKFFSSGPIEAGLEVGTDAGLPGDEYIKIPECYNKRVFYFLSTETMDDLHIGTPEVFTPKEQVHFDVERVPADVANLSINKEREVVEAKNPIVNHWAIYIGPWRYTGREKSAPHVVVHLPGEGDPRKTPSFLHFVRSPIRFASLEVEIENSIQWRINNQRSTRFQFRDCRPQEEVAAVAIESGLRKEPLPEFKEYDFLECNCEHFAKWCFHGEKESLQTSTWLASLMKTL
ncbi:hypothetical protein QYM36_018296 [Artemia franciscana]|uniref:LRAT domain-containing protein n=1 Tax=Artemia franciscana TaxID=6661 RepID=A0AA88L0I0_ARTSF|nr:hypothetical protein QYM36_018296 [Artemia franciscana]